MYYVGQWTECKRHSDGDTNIEFTTRRTMKICTRHGIICSIQVAIDYSVLENKLYIYIYICYMVDSPKWKHCCPYHKMSLFIEFMFSRVFLYGIQLYIILILTCHILVLSIWLQIFCYLMIFPFAMTNKTPQLCPFYSTNILCLSQYSINFSSVLAFSFVLYYHKSR